MSVKAVSFTFNNIGGYFNPGCARVNDVITPIFQEKATAGINFIFDKLQERNPAKYDKVMSLQTFTIYLTPDCFTGNYYVHIQPGLNFRLKKETANQLIQSIQSEKKDGVKSSSPKEKTPDQAETLGLLDQIVKVSESLSIPLTFAKAAADFGAYFTSLEALCGQLLQYLGAIDAPRQVIALLNEIRKVARAFLGSDDELRANTATLSKLILSITSSACNILLMLQRAELIRPALALSGPLGFIGTSCSVISAVIPLAMKAKEIYDSNGSVSGELIKTANMTFISLKAECQSVLRTGSETLRTIAGNVKGSIKGTGVLTGALSSALEVNQDVNATAEKRDLLKSAPKFLGSLLTLHKYLTGSKKTKFFSAGLKFFTSGYHFLQRMLSFS